MSYTCLAGENGVRRYLSIMLPPNRTPYSYFVNCAGDTALNWDLRKYISVQVDVGRICDPWRSEVGLSALSAPLRWILGEHTDDRMTMNKTTATDERTKVGPWKRPEHRHLDPHLPFHFCLQRRDWSRLARNGGRDGVESGHLLVVFHQLTQPPLRYVSTFIFASLLQP